MPKSYFQRQFSMSKINWFFHFFSLKNIKLGGHLLFRKIFLTLLLKPCPIFDGAELRQFSKYNIFLEAHSFFDKIKLILDTPGLNKKKQADITIYKCLFQCLFPVCLIITMQKKRSLLCHYIMQHEIFTVNILHLTYVHFFIWMRISTTTEIFRVRIYLQSKFFILSCVDSSWH